MGEVLAMRADAPSCALCGETGDVRQATDPAGYAPPEFVCRACFERDMPLPWQPAGPDWDDLRRAG